MSPSNTGRMLLLLLVLATGTLVWRTAVNLQHADVPVSMVLPSGSQALEVGEQAPDLRLATLGGDTLSIRDLRGKVVLVDFWATWCGPCVAEMPALQRLYEEMASDGVEIVGISVDRNRALVPPFVERLGLKFPILYGGLGDQALYKVVALPTLFVVDQEGVIRFRHIGYAPGAEIVLADEVVGLLVED
jgi:cytochrome c biogenesis protein CcmG/thiol:disulfide interchange protein DsbE